MGRLSYPLPLNLVSVSWKIMMKKKISFKNTSTDHLIQRFRFWVYTWRKWRTRVLRVTAATFTEPMGRNNPTVH